MDLSELVECEIDSISFLTNTYGRQLKIGIKTHTRGRVVMVAEAVESFLLESMRERNYIDSVKIFDRKNIVMENERATNGIFYLLQHRSIEETDLKIFGSVIAEEIDAILNGFKILVQIDALYGADMIFIAKSLKIEELAE